MKKLLYGAVGLLCILLLPGWLFAQEKTITGKITDASLKPLAGVSIVINKTTKGTVTDVSGQFTLSVPTGAQLVVTEAGFKTKTISIEPGQTDLSLVMEEDFARLDEVVVTGLSTTAKRKNLANAVVTINAKN